MIDETLSAIVDISKIVTSSKDFFAIKDIVVEKMLEVVPPKRACVNLFKNNLYDHTYLVCKNTIEEILKNACIYPEEDGSIKLPIETFPTYIIKAVEEKKTYYAKNVFREELAELERPLAAKSGYSGRLVVPLISSDKLRGFMTCFVDDGDTLSEKDINFINSVASLMALSIEITYQNREIDDILQKFRDAIISVENRAEHLYEDQRLDVYFKLIAEDICKITSSESVLIYVEDKEYGISVVESFGDVKKIKYVNEFLKSRESSGRKIYQHETMPTILKEYGISSIAFDNLIKDDVMIGKIILVNSSKYHLDDIRILNIFSTQIILSIYIFINNRKLLENTFIHRDLELINQQQQLIMKDEIMDEDDIVTVDYLNIPFRYVGGDFCKFEKVDDGKYILFIADVMGHGIMANYFVAMMKGAINLILTMTSSPSTILAQLNNILFKELDKMDIFITAKMMFFDFKNNKAYSSNAGHTVPICIYKDENGERKYKMLEGRSAIAIGIFEDTVYEEDIIDISGIEMFAIYTDGVIETKDRKGVEYGAERLAEYLITQMDKNIDKPCENIKKDLHRFRDNEDREDDITIFTLKLKNND